MLTEQLLPRRRIEAIAPWPYQPAPLPDELLSSFLCRLAVGMDLKPITFLNTVFGSRKNLLAQDLDNHAPERIIERVSAGTQRSGYELADCTLPSYVGTLLTTHNPRGRNPWLLPTTIDNNIRHRFGLQYCPACLAEDERPYYRKIWRLGFVTACTRHGKRLRDRCPRCVAPLHPHAAATAIRRSRMNVFSASIWMRPHTTRANPKLLQRPTGFGRPREKRPTAISRRSAEKAARRSTATWTTSGSSPNPRNGGLKQWPTRHASLQSPALSPAYVQSRPERRCRLPTASVSGSWR